MRRLKLSRTEGLMQVRVAFGQLEEEQEAEELRGLSARERERVLVLRESVRLAKEWEEAEFDDEYDPHYFRDKYRSSLNMRIGFENKLPIFNTIGRIGYIRQPLTFKGPRENNIGDPFIDVVNGRDYLTFGLSKKFDESFSLDIAYAHGFWSVEEGNRKDKEYHNRLYLSLTYRLPEQYK